MSDLRDLLAKATPGRWAVRSADEPDSYLADVVEHWRKWIAEDDVPDPGLDLIPSYLDSPRLIDCEDDGGFIPKADAELAVAAVNALPALLDVVDAARDVLVEWDALGPTGTEDTVTAHAALRDALRRLEGGA